MGGALQAPFLRLIRPHTVEAVRASRVAFCERDLIATPMDDITEMEALALRSVVVESHVRHAVVLILLCFHHLYLRRCVELRHTVLDE